MAKSTRVLTVSGTYWAHHFRRYAPPEERVPNLRLCGYWLAQAGLKSGVKVQVTVTSRRIVIKRM